MRRTAFLVATTVFLGGSPLGRATILTPAGYEGRCHLTHQTALVLFYKDKEWLSLEARYALEAVPPSPGEMSYAYSTSSGSKDEDVLPPARLAWVVPVPAGATPSTPPDGDALQDLYLLTHPSMKSEYDLKTRRPRGLNRFGTDAFNERSVSVSGEAVAWVVFDGSGETALRDLKEWIQKEGFNGLDVGLAEDYSQRGWTFAVGVLEKPEKTGVLGGAAFQFDSTEVVLPLRFQAHVGEFDFALYTFSEKELETRSLAGWRIRGVRSWERANREAWFKGFVPLDRTTPPTGLVAYLEKLLESSTASISPQELLFYVWEGDRLNGYGRTTAEQKRDFALPDKQAAKATGSPKQGSSGRGAASRARSWQTGYGRAGR